MLAARAAGIDLGFEGSEPALVRADAMLLGELVRNLIDNTIAYAGRDVDATLRISAGDAVMLEMSDNGRGISTEELAAVRRRFARGKSDKPGAGLGLPIVEEIAQLFGGTLSLDSAPDQGFRATIRFPLQPKS